MIAAEIPINMRNNYLKCPTGFGDPDAQHLRLYTLALERAKVLPRTVDSISEHIGRVLSFVAGYGHKTSGSKVTSTPPPFGMMPRRSILMNLYTKGNSRFRDKLVRQMMENSSYMRD